MNTGELTNKTFEYSDWNPMGWNDYVIYSAIKSAEKGETGVFYHHWLLFSFIVWRVLNTQCTVCEQSLDWTKHHQGEIIINTIQKKVINSC